jgi:L,D-transpeptidase catalytic domain
LPGLRLSGGIVATAAALAVPPLALADGPPPEPGPPPPAPAPPPAPPQPGSARIDVVRSVRFHGRAYVLSGSRVTLQGHVTPYVAGQLLTVTIRSPHRRPAVVHASVVARGAEGVFNVVFKVRRAVSYRVTAVHAPTPEQLAFSAQAAVQAVAGRGGQGARGVGIALLKQGLRRLGYPAGSGPFWTGKLGREVLTFRKVNGMARVFTADRHVFAMVFAGRGAFELRHPRAGRHVEFDWSRQVLALASGSKVVAVYHASSGKPSTPTVLGTFHFYSKAPGTNAKGMFMSNYFTRGYAVHGYPDVPTYAASHGCIRVPNADAPAIYARIRIGEPIFIYR